jgi:biotin carboxyl carrier protein
MSNLNPAPKVEVVTVDSATAGQDKTATVEAPFDGVVEAVHIVPVTALTGADTDSRTVTVVNNDADGTPTVAEKAFVLGVNAPASRETVITLSETAADLVVTAGDEIEIQSNHVGSTGLAGPEFEARVRFRETVASTEHPGVRNVTAETQVAAAAANADADGGFVEAPFDGTVTAVTVVLEDDITGANTDSRTLSVVNHGNSDAAVASLAFVSGTDGAKDEETALPLSTDAADLVVSKGDILEFASTHVGSSGLAGPAFRGQVTFRGS